nr:hypothetical protein [Planctomycetota bacterium]
MRPFLVLAWLCTVMALDAADADPGGLRLVPDRERAEWVRTRIQEPLLRHCGECHANGEADGGYTIDSHRRILSGGHDYSPGIRPWEPERSRVLQMLRWELDEDLNMPPKQQAPAEFIADMERWVALGAPWPDVAAIPPPADAPQRPPWLARLHPLVVHLPIGAALVALLLESLAILRRRGGMHPGTPAVLAGAIVGVALAITSGLLLPSNQAVAQVEAHENAGWFAAAALVLAMTSTLIAAQRPRWLWPARVLVVTAVALIALAGHR